LATGVGTVLRPVLVFTVALALHACASSGGNAPVTVTDLASPTRQTEAAYRDVIAGDTLYSIAWESGRDYRELAAWNRIAPPYTIKPGQRIRLQPPAATPGKPNAPTAHTVQRGETMFSIASRYDVAVAELAAWNGIASPYTIKPGQSLRLTAPHDRPDTKVPPRTESRTARKTESAPAVASTKAAPASVKASSAAIGAWTWPAEGSLLLRFNSSNAKGIDIGGKAGQTIVAAAPGTVVYQGSGLRGYGQLIIVKHNAEFLSAYAHCDKIVVREGNVIKRGQKIAEMGSSGTDRVKLHFEIRHRGTPVDPLDHLPKR
jgi:lipoprotein NlpD